MGRALDTDPGAPTAFVVERGTRRISTRTSSRASATLPISNIRNADIRAWVAELTAAGYAPATVAKGKQILSKILQAAVDDRRLPFNPADRVPVPRIEREEMRYLTPTQVNQVADAIDPRYRGLVLLGAYGGLRLGEMFGLRWGSVDLLRRRVKVNEICVEVRGEVLFGPPKTKAGVRTVPIPSVVADELAKLTGPNPDPKALVFTGGEGCPAACRRLPAAGLVSRDQGSADSTAFASTTSATPRSRCGSRRERTPRRSRSEPATRRW